MVIGIDASRASRQEKTGVETYSFALIGALRTVVPSETRVFLYSDTPKPADFGESRFHQWNRGSSTRSYESGLPASWEWRQLGRPGARLWTQAHLSREMRRNPPDVLFIPAHVLPFIHPRRSVVTIHDVSFMRAPEVYRSLSRAYLRWSTAFALARASRIIVPSEWTKRELMHFFGAREEQIVVIPHGIDREKYRPATEADIASVGERYGLGMRYVLALGRVEKKKNLQTLLKAAAILRKRGKPIPEIVFAGPDGFGSEEVRKAVADLGLADRVRFLGFVPERDLPALIASAGAVAVPGALEGFGLPVLQGFAAGVPVIAARAGALPEAAGDAALLVPPNDAEAWANALGTILTDGAVRDRLRTAATARLSAFSWQQCAEETWKTITFLRLL